MLTQQIIVHQRRNVGGAFVRTLQFVHLGVKEERVASLGTSIPDDTQLIRDAIAGLEHGISAYRD